MICTRRSNGYFACASALPAASWAMIASRVSPSTYFMTKKS
jgi:hypothetical protein